MRCIVTGAAGFIGSHLTERLLAEGHDVCGIDAFVNYYPRHIKESNLERLRSSSHFTFVEGDLLDVDLPALLEGADWIFHQAAQAGVRASWGGEFSHYADWNVLATQRLLEASLHVKSLRRFVYASSSSVYGDTTTLPITEAVMPRPISPYGVTKLAGEHLCTLYHHNFGLPTVSLRYFTVYGPRQRPDMAFHRFCAAILAGQPVYVYDDGNQTRDFTYISDIIDANMRAARADAAIGQIMNIAGGSRVTLHDVMHLLQEIHGAPFDIVFKEKQHGDVRHTYADTSLAGQLLEYRPSVALLQGLSEEFAYVASLYQRNYAVLV